MRKDIDTLKMFFKITVAAFDMHDAVISAVGGTTAPNRMKTLHIMAMEELESPIPNLGRIDFLLEQMELLAEQNKLNS